MYGCRLTNVNIVTSIFNQALAKLFLPQLGSFVIACHFVCLGLNDSTTVAWPRILNYLSLSMSRDLENLQLNLQLNMLLIMSPIETRL